MLEHEGCVDELFHSVGDPERDGADGRVVAVLLDEGLAQDVAVTAGAKGAVAHKALVSEVGKMKKERWRGVQVRLKLLQAVVQVFAVLEFVRIGPAGGCQNTA